MIQLIHMNQEMKYFQQFSGINDIYVVFGTNNLILLATTDGVVVIEESKGNESNSLFKYFYIEE